METVQTIQSKEDVKSEQMINLEKRVSSLVAEYCEAPIAIKTGKITNRIVESYREVWPSPRGGDANRGGPDLVRDDITVEEEEVIYGYSKRNSALASILALGDSALDILENWAISKRVSLPQAYACFLEADPKKASKRLIRHFKERKELQSGILKHWESCPVAEIMPALMDVLTSEGENYVRDVYSSYYGAVNLLAKIGDKKISEALIPAFYKKTKTLMERSNVDEIDSLYYQLLSITKYWIEHPSPKIIAPLHDAIFESRKYNHGNKRLISNFNNWCIGAMDSVSAFRGILESSGLLMKIIYKTGIERRIFYGD